MASLKLSQLAKLLHMSYVGPEVDIKGFSTDSRTILPGEMFVALAGERVNGHHYLQQVEEKGASAVMVSEKVATNLPKLEVSNTVSAFGSLGKAYRDQFTLPICAITGSCGKTTIKEMLAAILLRQGEVLANRGNLNTEIGVPLTLLRLNQQHKMAIIEMGATKEGDIAYLMNLVSPVVSMISNAGVAHLEFFGSEEGIAKAKGEIFANLNPTGTAIINQDDKYAPYWRSLLKDQSVLSFGLSKDASVFCKNLIQATTHSSFDLVSPQGQVAIELPVPGIHNVQNALAASAAALAMGATLEDIRLSLSQFVPVSGRLQFKTSIEGAQIIDDTYNANPISMRAALGVLSKYNGKKVFVMGDMFELGKDASLRHREIGREAKNLGIDLLFGVGSLTANAVDAFGEGAKLYPDKISLIQDLKKKLDSKTTVLVKGSRSMRMEEVVSALVEESKAKG